jgi:hypothetical protein
VVSTHLASADPAPNQTAKAKVTAEYLKLPMSFEINQGQSDPEVKALARGSGYGLFLTSSESAFLLAPGKDQAIIRVRTLGANPAAQASGLDRLDSSSNYFIGNDPSKWRRNVPNYARVKVHSVYPGIDIVYYGNQRQLEYDYLVAPGADPNSIRLAIEGTRKLRIDRAGNLVLETTQGRMVHHKPLIYQQIDGVRRQIAGRFALRGNRVSFQLGSYDRSKELVIDPSLTFLTYLGGSGADQGKALTVTTATGVTLIAGATSSTNFPTANPLYSYTGQTDGFISAIDATGETLLNSTYFGGNGGVNLINGIAVDWSLLPAMLYVAGTTTSTSLPVLNAAQPTYGGGASDGWIARINLAVIILGVDPLKITLDTSLSFATYLGGSGAEEITGVAMDQFTKDAFVTGVTTSTNFPVTSGVLQSTNAGGADAFVTRYASSTGSQVFSTYLGGTGTDAANGIAVYTNSNTNTATAYIAGVTTSSTFPATVAGPAAPAASGVTRAFLTAVSGDGTTSPFSDLIGVTAGRVTEGTAVTTDTAGNIYVTGVTNDPALPTVNPVQSAFAGGGLDAFAGEYNASGAATFLSYYGGKGYDWATSIGVSSTGTETNIFIAGYTTGSLPAQVAAIQSTYGGGPTDGFVTLFSSSHGEAYGVAYATYLGGSGTDIIYGLAVDSSGNAHLTGVTNSTNLAVTTGAYEPANAGGYDAFIAAIQTTP